MTEALRALACIALLALLACAPDVTWEPAQVPPIAPPPSDPTRVVDDASHEGFDDDEAAPVNPALEALRHDARAVEPLVEGSWVREMLQQVATLPPPPARTLYHDADKTRYLVQAEYDALSPEERDELSAQPVDGKLYYLTKYGSPVAYARPLFIAAQAGLARPKGASIVDFGYGGIGHLRMLAALGAHVTAVDVDPFLRALYHGDGGSFPQGRRSAGHIELLDGRWPADPDIRKALGSDHQLFLAKNVLKRGYIHPEQKVPDKQTVKLGVSDDAFVAALAEAVALEGFVMIYNLTPAPNEPGKPYRTWADGRCPFPETMWRKHGFEVVAFDRDDTEAARRLGLLLGWASAEELAKDLFATYSLFRRASR
jgi:hypothetical protein